LPSFSCTGEFLPSPFSLLPSPFSLLNSPFSIPYSPVSLAKGRLGLCIRK
jgi:hypothetical protein